MNFFVVLHLCNKEDARWLLNQFERPAGCIPLYVEQSSCAENFPAPSTTLAARKD